MREIKFRVFDTKENKMIEHFLGARIDYALHYWETHKHVSEPMQYTGMHDKNGVEIYEGDIVEIQFQDGVVNMFVEYSRCSFHLSGDGYWSMSGNSDMFKVIGNIHQHAHLLEQNKC